MSKKPNPMQAQTEKSTAKTLAVIAGAAILFIIMQYDLPTWTLWLIALPLLGYAYAYYKIEANVVDYDKPDSDKQEG